MLDGKYNDLERSAARLVWLTIIARTAIFVLVMWILSRMDWTHGLKGVLTVLWEGAS